MENWSTLLLHWLVSAVALAVTAAITPGFRIRGFFSALIAVLLIGAANFFLYPVLFFLTLPLTVLTLGLFVFVIDAIILRICAALMDSFEIKSWFSAIIGAVILALTSSVLHAMLI